MMISASGSFSAVEENLVEDEELLNTSINNKKESVLMMDVMESEKRRLLKEQASDQGKEGKSKTQ